MAEQPSVSDLQDKAGQAPEIPKEPAQEPTITPDSLLSELEKLNIDTPEDLQGMANASQQAGRTAELLGQEKQRSQALEQRLAALEQQQRQNPDYPTDYSSNEGVDLIKTVENAVRNVITNDYIRPNQQASQRYLAEMSQIRGDREYGYAGPSFEEHMQDPITQNQIAQGMTTPIQEYRKVVVDKMRGDLLGSRQVIEGMQGQSPASVQVPHVESGSSATVPIPDADTEKNEKLKRLTRPENRVGTTDEVRQIFETILPTKGEGKDPIWG